MTLSTGKRTERPLDVAGSSPSPRCFERGEGKPQLVGARERGLRLRAIRGPSLRAFTLLELILVISVIALAAALTVPMLGRFSHGRRDTDAVAQFLAVIQYAQDEAANSATPYRVQLDANSQTYWLTLLEASDYVRPHNDFGQTFTLPDTLTASWDSPPDIAQRGYIQFDPDGGHDLALIKLASKDSGEFVIGCPSPSEPYRITQPGSDKEIR